MATIAPTPTPGQTALRALGARLPAPAPTRNYVTPTGVATSNPGATNTNPTVISSPAAKTFVDTKVSETPTHYDTPNGLAPNGQQGALSPEQIAAGNTPAGAASTNTTGTGEGSTDPTAGLGDITSNTAPQTAYDMAMNTYLKSLKAANDLTLQGKKDSATALDSGETLGFASGEEARVNRNNSFAIDAATNLASANKEAVAGLKDRLPATPQPFSLTPGESRYDASGKLIASTPGAAKAPQIIGSASTGYYSVDAATGKLTSILKPDTSGGVGTSAQDIEDWAQAVQNGNSTIAQVPLALRTAVAHALNTASGPDGAGGTYSPLAASRETLAASRIANNFIDLPQYQLTANGLPYLQRIDAAIKTPGSVSDQDLLDSLTKLNTAGNAISDAQVKIITDGRSLSDLANVLGNKLSSGGVLSSDQRNQIQKIAKAIYANYKQGYQPVYDQVTAQLTAAGIPKQFWTIPDLNNLSKKAEEGSPSTLPQNIQDAVRANTTLSADGTTATIPRSVWSTFGASMDAVLAEAKKDGITLLIK